VAIFSQEIGEALYTVGEILAAAAAAACASYVRAKNVDSWKLNAICATCAESIVSGALAIGIASYLDFDDPRTAIGMSAGFGLIGTKTISEFLIAFVSKRVDIPIPPTPPTTPNP
jgi:hypothetical protein